MEKAQLAWWRRKRPDRLTVRLMAGTAGLFLLTAIFATDVDDFIYPNDIWGKNLTTLGVVIVFVLPTYYFALLRPLLRLFEEKRRSEEGMKLRVREMGAVNAVSEVAAREPDLERLLSRVTDFVLSVFEAQGGQLLTFHGSASRPQVVVSRGLPPALGKAASADLCMSCPTSCWGILERLPPGEITLITECLDLPREALLAAGFGGYVGVLLPVGRHVGAVLHLVWRVPPKLDEADRTLLRAIARQIGIAADNVALFEAEQRARQAADTIASVSVALNRTLDLDTVLQSLFHQLGRFVSYDRAQVMLVEPESRSGFRVFSPSGSTNTAGEVPTSFDAIQSPFVTDVLQTQRSRCVADLQSQSHPAEARRTRGEIERSWLGVPLLVAGRVIGLVTLVKAEPGFYTPGLVSLAEALAAPASVAIANARLFGEVLSGRKRLETISRKLVGVEEAERRHLARELHDEIGQSLTAIFYRLAAAQSAPGSAANRILEEAIEITDRTIKVVRDLSLDLSPSLLDEAGLGETLRWYIDRQVRSDSLDVGLSGSESVVDLPPDVRGACFRIVQEALTNVVRHAQARKAQVNLRRSETGIAVAVWDDGRGFDVDEACQRARTGHSLGILGMQERAELLGGKLAFESTPGGGTTVRAWVPVPESL